MTPTRESFFAAVREFAPGRTISNDDFRALDGVARRWGLAEVDGLQPSQAALDLIKSFEGCRLKAYPDPGTGGDPWTIGWGSTGPDIKPGLIWTQEEADARFAAHAHVFSAGVLDALDGAATEQREFDAMVSLAYNIGLGAFRSSTLLRKHKAGDKGGAAAEFGRWNKAGGRVLNGLTRRRRAEADMYLGGA